jgi:hypothetical protein
MAAGRKIAACWTTPEYAAQREELRRRDITLEQVTDWDFEPLSPKENWNTLHQKDIREANLIAMPCPQADGSLHAERRYMVVGEAIRKTTGKKYTQPSATGAILTVVRPKKLDKKFKSIIYITEGEIKAWVGAHATGAIWICVPGVDCFMRNGKLDPEIAHFAKKGYTFRLAYDTDQERKYQTVLKRQFELADLLTSVGVKVELVDLPRVRNLKKTGADDVVQFLGAPALLNATRHDFPDSEWAIYWREEIAKTIVSGGLPTSLRDLKPVPWDWYTKDPPPIEYVLERYLQENEVAMFAGPGSVGKSYFMMEAAVCIATGSQFFGLMKKPAPRRCMYVMAERHEKNLMRRFHKIAHHIAERSTDPKERERFEQRLKMNYYTKSLAGESLQLIEFVSQQWRPAFATLDALIEELKLAKIEVIFADPISRFQGGNENAAEIVSAVIKALEYISQHTGCSCVFLHHTGKSERDDQYVGRGSSAWTDNTSETVALSLVEKRDELEIPKVEGKFGAVSAVIDEDDIVLVRHHRCSDGQKEPDMYVVRDHATGLLRHVEGLRRKAGAKIDGELLEVLRKWADSLEGKVFTKSKCGTEAPHAKKRNAFRKWFEGAIGTTFVDTGEKQNGYPLYTIKGESASAPANSGQLANSKQNGVANSKTANTKKGGKNRGERVGHP